jgi:hypothetical protein
MITEASQELFRGKSGGRGVYQFLALALKQLDANNHGRTHLYSPSLDLKPKDGTAPLEVDFVWIMSGDARRKSKIVLGECKDRQEDAIDGTDIESLQRAADALPRDRFDTFTLLAKLVPFSDREIAFARTLNSQYQRHVILLTARELEPYHFFERTKKEFPMVVIYFTQVELRPPPQVGYDDDSA